MVHYVFQVCEFPKRTIKKIVAKDFHIFHSPSFHIYTSGICDACIFVGEDGRTGCFLSQNITLKRVEIDDGFLLHGLKCSTNIDRKMTT